jgi:hypothetical protein
MRRAQTRFYAKQRSSHDRHDLPTAKGRAKSPADRMNKGEQRYAETLETRKAAGLVAAWWFEGISWRLTDNTHYKPDFLVMLADGTLEIHEVKGRSGNTFTATETGWAKVKIVAEQAPFPVRVVWQTKDGHWQEQRV